MNIEKIRKEKALKFKKKRIEAGLSQLQLAVMSGLKQSTISKMESGNTSWHIDSEILYLNAIEEHIHSKKNKYETIQAQNHKRV